MHNDNEKGASETDPFPNYHNTICTSPHSFHQEDNVLPLGYWLDKIVEDLSRRGTNNLEENHND